jgi:hypothetical protein
MKQKRKSSMYEADTGLEEALTRDGSIHDTEPIVKKIQRKFGMMNIIRNTQNKKQKEINDIFEQ